MSAMLKPKSIPHDPQIKAQMAALADPCQYRSVQRHLDLGCGFVSVFRVGPNLDLAEVAAFYESPPPQEEMEEILGQILRDGDLSVIHDPLPPDLWVDVIALPPFYLIQARKDQ